MRTVTNIAQRSFAGLGAGYNDYAPLPQDQSFLAQPESAVRTYGIVGSVVNGTLLYFLVTSKWSTPVKVLLGAGLLAPGLALSLGQAVSGKAWWSPQ
jgi:hypothetical protein